MSAMPVAPYVLNDDELAILRTYGSEEPAAAQSVLFAAGEATYDLIVLLEGRAQIAEDDWQQRVVATFGPSEFLGELDLLTGKRVSLTGTMLTDGRILRLPVAQLRRVIANELVLSEVILRAFLSRRANLEAMGAGLTLIGARNDPETRRLLETLRRNRLAVTWLDLDADTQADALLTRLAIPRESLPIVLMPGRALLINPTLTELRDALGLVGLDDPGASDYCDLLIVGAGPGGLAAAVYGASEGLSTTLIEGTALGGQAGTSSRIENYLGFPAGLPGAELAARAVLQAQKFNVHIRLGTQALKLTSSGGLHRVRCDDNRTIVARAVIIACGAHYRQLPLEGLESLESVGVYYAATGMEARACASSPVVVVGGGNSAGQAALYLARGRPQVAIVVRRDGLGATMSHYLTDAIENNPRITVIPNANVTRLIAEKERLAAVEITHSDTGLPEAMPAAGLFVFIGVHPNTHWLSGQAARDDQGFLLTGSDVPRQDLDPAVASPLALETSRPGVFCVGDARSGSVKRVATAIGEGAMAVRLTFERFASSGGPDALEVSDLRPPDTRGRPRLDDEHLIL